ncbi:hypothetical protein D9M73_292300 [compost metagenome]
MSLALQAGFTLLAVLQPGAAVFQLAGGLPFASDFDEHGQRGGGVGDDAQVRGEHAADLGAFDVDVNELAAFCVHIH